MTKWMSPGLGFEEELSQELKKAFYTYVRNANANTYMIFLGVADFNWANLFNTVQTNWFKKRKQNKTFSFLIFIFQRSHRIKTHSMI